VSRRHYLSLVLDCEGPALEQQCFDLVYCGRARALINARVDVGAPRSAGSAAGAAGEWRCRCACGEVPTAPPNATVGVSDAWDDGGGRVQAQGDSSRRVGPPCRKGSREVALTDQQAEGTCHDGLLPSQRPCGL
jgi:hypothetical protein